MPLVEYTRECQAAAQADWHSRYRTADGGPPLRSIPVFENRIIEHVLARAHPLTPIVWFGPLIGHGLYAGSRRMGVAATAGTFASGWALWSLLEYLLHRFVFHMRAETPERRLRAFLLHGYHHVFPHDPMRLVAPPLMSWPLAAGVGGVIYLLLGAPRGLALFFGIAAGYVAYDWIHYATHHFKLKGPIGRWLKRYHLLHHFDTAHEGTRFGVSSPLWDLVFGTYVPARRHTR